MKGLLSIVVCLCLVLLGTQDITSVEVYNQGMDVQISSIQKTIKEKAVQQHHEIAFDLAGASNYMQILSKLSRERGNTNNILRLLNKFHSNQSLKEFNIRQKTCELVSTSQIINNSSLHHRFAHFVYELQKILI